MMSMRGRKTITDAWGNYLFTLREKMMSWRTTYLGEDQNGTVLFELKKKTSCEYAVPFLSTLIPFAPITSPGPSSRTRADR